MSTTTDVLGLGKVAQTLTGATKDVGSAIYGEIKPVSPIVPAVVGVGLGLLVFILLARYMWPDPERWRNQQCCEAKETVRTGNGTTTRCVKYRPCQKSDLYPTPVILLMYLGIAALLGLIGGSLAYKLAFTIKNPGVAATLHTGQAVRNIFRR